MVQFISVFIVAILFTACSAAPVKRGVETLQADISEIALHTAALDDAVTAFPEVGATLKDTEPMNTASAALQVALVKGITDTQTDPFTEADAHAIFAAVGAYQPRMLHFLTTTVAKKSAFGYLPIDVPSAVLQGLTNFKGDTDKFFDALIGKSLETVRSDGIVLKTTVDNAFVETMAAYS